MFAPYFAIIKEMPIFKQTNPNNMPDNESTMIQWERSGNELLLM